MIALYDGNDDPFRQMELSDRFIDPGIPVGELDLNEMYIFFPAVLGHPFDAGVLVDEAGGYDTGRDGDHAYAEEGDENAEQLAERGDRVNVSVAHGEQRGGRPPDAGECIGKYFRLRFVFETVHAQAGGEHQDQDRKYRGEKLLAFALQDVRDQPQRIIVGIDPEEPEHPHDTQHPESGRARREEYRQIIRQKRQHINNPGKGQDILPHSTEPFRFGIHILGGEKAQDIIRTEHRHGNIFDQHQSRPVLQTVFFICIHNAGGQVQDDRQQIADIKNLGGTVCAGTHLKNLVDAVSDVIQILLIHSTPPFGTGQNSIWDRVKFNPGRSKIQFYYVPD